MFRRSKYDKKEKNEWKGVKGVHGMKVVVLSRVGMIDLTSKSDIRAET